MGYHGCWRNNEESSIIAVREVPTDSSPLELEGPA